MSNRYATRDETAPAETSWPVLCPPEPEPVCLRCKTPHWTHDGKWCPYPRQKRSRFGAFGSGIGIGVLAMFGGVLAGATGLHFPWQVPVYAGGGLLVLCTVVATVDVPPFIRKYFPRGDKR
jgi:hypothetical protein